MDVQVILWDYHSETKIFSFNIDHYPPYEVNFTIDLVRYDSDGKKTTISYKIIKIDHCIKQYNSDAIEEKDKTTIYIVNVYVIGG